MTTLTDHVERFLGRIAKGWKDRSSDRGLQVVRFEGTRSVGVDTFLTLGLSRHTLSLSSNKSVRQELVFAGSEAVAERVVHLLLYLCELGLREHQAFLRGQALRLPPVQSGSMGFDAVYCTMPVFIDDDFATFRSTEPPTVFVWVIPIYASEAAFIESNGWSAFEDLLEEKDPDLFASRREPVV